MHDRKEAILSSDAGEPLFPNAIACMRMMRGFMRAFGLNKVDSYGVTVNSPAVIVARY